MTDHTTGDGAALRPAGGGSRRRGTARRDKPATIRDVAARAGVSVATVSRTPAGNYPVSETTRARVTAAVEALHYVVNAHAKALSGGVPGPVALVLHDITSPSPAHVAAGVEQEAATRGRLVATAQQRRAGHLDALRAYGVPYEEELDVPGPYTRTSGYLRTRDALRAGPGFTAVFAGTDMVALGALAALREAGLSVPDDVSLVGYDDVPFAADLTPALTTVRVPYEDLGRSAVRLALEREERVRADDHVVLSTHLVVRQSVTARG